MNYRQTIEYIHSLGNFSKPTGLERITMLMDRLDNPQNKFEAIHIAGTNGKGSTCVMLSEIFKRAGYKTGLYISPYIVKFNERIQINGECISDEDLTNICNKIKQDDNNYTEFEFITAAAFYYFAEQKCDIVVVETGLGGRLDATNVLSNKSISIITKIGIDHSAILGNSLKKIAEEKCGIIKNGITITSPYQPKEALEVINKSANNLVIPNFRSLQIKKSNINGNEFIYKDKRYETTLVGEHQIENALCVIEAVESFKDDIPYNVVFEGIKNAFIPARLECVNREKNIFIDGSHNTDAAKRLADFLKGFKGTICAIVGTMRDKDYKGVLKEVLPLCDFAVCVDCDDTKRALKANQLLLEAEKYCPCEEAKTIDEALKRAEAQRADMIIAFGSLYLAANIRKKLNNF